MEVDEPASEVNVEVKEDTEPETKVRLLEFFGGNQFEEIEDS